MCSSDLGVVAAYYALAGVALLTLFAARPLDARLEPTTFTFLSWTVGATFGGGQLLAAAILYWHLERAPRGHKDAAHD